MVEILTEKKKTETIYPQMNAKNANVKNVFRFYLCVLAFICGK